MSHHIYHTKALILGSRPKGEANKVFVLYTRELGLVHATAQSIRHSRSRLRYALQEYAYVHVDLVRGRDVWRVTSATSQESFQTLRSNHDSFVIMHNIFRLIERLCTGEEANPDIFDDVLTACLFLNESDKDEREREIAELCLVLRTLHNLGYIGTPSAFEKILYGAFNTAVFSQEELPKKSILFEINRALRESQL